DSYTLCISLREHAASFVKVHNTHRIRSQPKRTYFPTGKPLMLFHAPSPLVLNHALDPDMELISVKITRLWQIMWEQLFRNMMIDYFSMIPQGTVYSNVYIKWYHLITGS